MCRGWWMRVFRLIYPVFCAICVLGGENDSGFSYVLCADCLVWIMLIQQLRLKVCVCNAQTCTSI